MTDEETRTANGEIGRRLRERRLERGLLQQDLATAEISASYVSLIEAGKRMPSPAVLKALAERVGSTVEYLRTGRDEAELQGLQLELGFAEMALRNGSPSEALQSLNHVLARAGAVDPTMLLQARIAQAAALERMGRLEAAISILQELCEEPGTLALGSSQWARATVALCRCYRVVGDFTMSIDIGERAIRRLDALGLDTTDDHIMLGVDLVGSYYHRSDFTRAHLLSTRLLARAEQTRSRTATGMVYWNASLVAESRGDRAEAIALVQRALGFMAEGDNLQYLARLKVLHAGLLLRTGTDDLTEAKALYEQAGKALTEVGSTHDRGDCAMGLALVGIRAGRYEEAKEHAGRAAELLAGEASILGAEIHVVLGEAQLLNGEDQEGEASLRTAERRLGSLPPSRAAASAYRHLGDVWNRHGDVPEAMRAYQQGLTAGGAEALPSHAPSLAPSSQTPSSQTQAPSSQTSSSRDSVQDR